LDLDDTQAAPSPVEGTATAAAAMSLGPGADSAALSPGLRLDHFRIERRLGVGGMGEVYLATDLALDRPVAIKVLRAGAATGAARERLLREARAQARVHHPNVGHIYFIGEDAGRLYFAMEYIAGKTLAERLADGPLPVEEALEVIHAAVLGLREAHRAGFTHRDVKPSNLMVDSHGVVKVLDFGLVAAAPDAATGAAPTAQTTLGGTPLYMAPEQARGEPIDLRADIYALGATLYHLVAGKPPFNADSAAELATLHRSANRPSVSRKAHGKSAASAIDALVAKMMAPNPAERFASYDELLQALELASAAHTRPAGFWVRMAATLVDSVLVLIAMVAAMFAMGIHDDVSMPATVTPVALLQLIAIAWRGTTPGKAMFELEVVNVASGQKPGLAAVVVRSLVLYGLVGAVAVVKYVVPLPSWAREGWPVVIAMLLPIAALARASLRVAGKRTPWDRVAGTMVRYKTSRRSAAL
jgi:hypothetical protein